MASFLFCLTSQYRFVGQKLFDGPGGLADAVFVLDQRESHEPLT
jgi:hypothetical protein